MAPHRNAACVPLAARRFRRGLIVGLALCTDLSGTLAFRRAGTNINPYRPALTVVRDGAYRYTRNPMHPGLVLLILGLGVAMLNPLAFLAALLLWGALHFGVVLTQER